MRHLLAPLSCVSFAECLASLSAALASLVVTALCWAVLESVVGCWCP